MRKEWSVCMKCFSNNKGQKDVSQNDGENNE